MTNRDRQPDQSSSRQRLLRCGGGVVWFVPLIVLLFVVTHGTAVAELLQRGRSLNYQPVTVQQPGTPQRHVAYRPAPEPQENQPPARFSDNRSRSSTEDFLNPSLPEPGGPIEPQIQTVLGDLSQKIAAVKSGGTVNPPDSTPGNATDGNENNAPATPGTGSKPIDVVEIFQDPKGNWFATLEGERLPIPLDKREDRFFRADDQGTEVFLGGSEQSKDSPKSSLADNQTRNALLLIVTTMAVLAALGIGMLAFDYKHRWEQEIVSQNNRLLGNGAAHGAIAELDSLEPDTLRFSPHDFGSLDDSFDHSFRTIA